MSDRLVAEVQADRKRALAMAKRYRKVLAELADGPNDPVARLTGGGRLGAAQIATRTKSLADELRTLRDQAATALRVVHGWSPVTTYRTIGVTRTLSARIVGRTVDRAMERYHDRHPGRVLVRRHTKDEPFSKDEVAAVREYLPVLSGNVDTAAAVAAALTVVAELDALAKDARKMRDQSAGALIGAGVESNASIAEMTGLSSARIAQVQAKRRHRIPA